MTYKYGNLFTVNFLFHKTSDMVHPLLVFLTWLSTWRLHLRSGEWLRDIIMINKFHIFIIDENMHFMFLWFLKSSTISLFCYHYTIRQHNLEYFCIHNHHYYSITFKNHYHSCVAIFPQFFRCVQNEIIPTAWQHSKDHVAIHSRAYCIHLLKILHCSKQASVVCTEQRNL